MRNIFCFLLLLFIPLCIQAQSVHTDSLFVEKIANARVVNVKDSAQLYITRKSWSDYEEAGKIALGTKVVVQGDTARDMIIINVFDTVRHIRREYLEFDSLAFKSGIYTARNDIGLMIPLKWFHIAVLLFALIAVICIFLPIPNKIATLLGLYTLMNGTFIAASLCHYYYFAFDNIWAGGWLNGYVLAYANGLLMLFVAVINYWLYSGVAMASLRMSTVDEDFHSARVKLLFWLPLLSAILVGVLDWIKELLGMVGMLFYIVIFVIHIISFKGHRILGFFIFLFAHISFACSCFYWMLFLRSQVLIVIFYIVLAAIAIKSAPGAIVYALTRETEKKKKEEYPHRMIHTEDGWFDAEFRGDGYYINGSTRYNRDSSTDIYMRD